MPNLPSTDALGMNVKTLKNIAAIACVAALAVPAGVLAKGPGGDHGKSGDQHGQKNKPHHVNKRCKKQPKVGFVVGGKLAQGATADNVSFVVTHSNKHARTFFPKGSTYTVADADESKIQYKGDNPFTTPGAELHRSDWKVQVIGKVIKNKKGCTAANSPAPTIKKIMVIAPGSGESGSNQSGSNESGSNESGGNQTGSNT
jgi:hypothetical protein